MTGSAAEAPTSVQTPDHIAEARTRRTQRRRRNRKRAKAFEAARRVDAATQEER